MSAEQVSLFGELDGLFAPELIPTTPAGLVELIPGDHVEAMRSADPGAPDEWDDRACPEYLADGIDGPTGEHCSACGWPESEHDEPAPDNDEAEIEEWRNRHDPRNDGPDLSHLPRHRRNAGMWSDAQHDGGCADLAHRWPQRIPPAHAEHDADDLFAAADLDAGTCEAPRCAEPATHIARHEHFESKEDGWTPAGAVITYGGMRCCLSHANYYAEAWLPIYPGQFGGAWLDILATGPTTQGA